MKKLLFFLCFSAILLAEVEHPLLKQIAARSELRRQYEHVCRNSSDIYEHIPVLRQLARQCSSVTEIGLRSLVSSWGIWLGLSESFQPHRSYLGIDLISPPEDRLFFAQRLVESAGISFQFWEANDMTIDIEPTDMLFIDSLHTYCHLSYELEKFAPKVRKYIAMHDTSEPWGDTDDSEYKGNYLEYPPEIDRTKRGLWPAVEDFLQRHPQWKLMERRLNNHGFTILKRSNESQWIGIEEYASPNVGNAGISSFKEEKASSLLP